MNRRMEINIWYVIVALFGVNMLQNFWFQAQHVQTIPYGEFDREQLTQINERDDA